VLTCATNSFDTPFLPSTSFFLPLLSLTHPTLFERFKCKFENENIERRKSWGTLISSQHFEGRRVCQSSKMGTRKSDKQVNYHTDLHKPNNKLFSAWLEHFWCTDKPRTYMDSQDSPRLGLGGSHHLPPYSILYD